MVPKSALLREPAFQNRGIRWANRGGSTFGVGESGVSTFGVGGGGVNFWVWGVNFWVGSVNFWGRGVNFWGGWQDVRDLQGMTPADLTELEMSGAYN